MLIQHIYPGKLLTDFNRGEQIDLREIPSVVGGDEESRHGIVLTK